ncbi:MAG: hypothetical protein HXX09_11555, partial [Bacteroidetes bacterium]|nr:hypothetical protein [Bacteroidota bacterium]
MNKTLLLICISFFSFTSIFGQNQYWQWAKSAGGVDYDYGTATATDQAGNVYV